MSPMARNPDANGRIHLTARVPVELVDALDMVAEARIMGRTKLIELLLMDGLARLEVTDAPISRLCCSNCGYRMDDHCDVHQIPCCPGKCDVSPTSGVVS